MQSTVNILKNGLEYLRMYSSDYGPLNLLTYRTYICGSLRHRQSGLHDSVSLSGSKTPGVKVSECLVSWSLGCITRRIGTRRDWWIAPKGSLCTGLSPRVPLTVSGSYHCCLENQYTLVQMTPFFLFPSGLALLA